MGGFAPPPGGFDPCLRVGYPVGNLLGRCLEVQQDLRRNLIRLWQVFGPLYRLVPQPSDVEVVPPRLDVFAAVLAEASLFALVGASSLTYVALMPTGAPRTQTRF